MHLFSFAIKQHKIKFTPLVNCLQHLDIAAAWAEGEWGYIRNKGFDYRRNVLSGLKNHVYIGTLNNQVVAMFVLFEKEMSSEFKVGKHKTPHVSELMYVYVDEPYRGLGFGLQIINEARQLAKLAKSEFILLDTLKPGLNRFYEKNVAEVIAENQLFSHPTEVLAMRL